MKILSKNQGGVPPLVAPKTDPAPAWENPLMPNKRLRQLYAAMVELRLLEENIASRQSRQRSSGKLHLHPGEEGVFASTILSLNPGDLTSESAPSIAPAFLCGAKLSSILSPPSRARKSLHELPSVADATVRLNLAIGASLGFVATKKGSLTVVYISSNDLTQQQWKPILKLAAGQVAPILFVALSGKSAKLGQLSQLSTTCGTPGIPVDAADPVALYRVTQESMLRIRAGGGPVLMECIPFQLPGKQAGPADPILTMQQFMLPRGVADTTWFNHVSTRFATRLRTQRE